MSAPAMLPWVCQPQYDVRNPLLVTSTDVSTKYTPFAVAGKATARDRAAHDRTDLRVAEVRAALRVRIVGLTGEVHHVRHNAIRSVVVRRVDVVVRRAAETAQQGRQDRGRGVARPVPVPDDVRVHAGVHDRSAVVVDAVGGPAGELARPRPAHRRGRRPAPATTRHDRPARPHPVKPSRPAPHSHPVPTPTCSRAPHQRLSRPARFARCPPVSSPAHKAYWHRGHPGTLRDELCYFESRGPASAPATSDEIFGPNRRRSQTASAVGQ